MQAVDTNVLVRYLTRDDEAQAMQAKSLLESNDVFISKTVFLELQWVLQSLYHQTPKACHELLLRLARARNVSVEDPKAVADALAWFGRGMDFADALHLAASLGTQGLCTFDKRLAKDAVRIGAGVVIMLPNGKK
jgi:predicted nucleic-acid-binding protein